MISDNISRVVFGNGIAVLMALYNFAQSQIQNKNRNSWVFLQDIMRMIFIFIAATIVYFIYEHKNKPNKEFSYWVYGLYLLGPISDYSGTFFINYGFQNSPEYLMFFVNQLIFPMNILVGKLFFNWNCVIPYNALILFFMLASITFINSHLLKKDRQSINFKSLIIGIVCGLLSNISFITNIRTVSIICDYVQITWYYIMSMPIMALLGFSLAMIFESNKIPTKRDLLKYYGNNMILLLISSVFGTGFYISGSYFIVNFGPTTFNIATLAFSSYSGLFLMAYMKDYNLIKGIIYGICMLITGIMLFIMTG